MVPEYMFTLTQRDLSEFEDMCRYNQTSPLSHFTENKFFSVATEKSRITVTAKKIKITVGDSVTEVPLDSEDEFLVALETYFHIKQIMVFSLHPWHLHKLRFGKRALNISIQTL